jgi:hypothetical protein
MPGDNENQSPAAEAPKSTEARRGAGRSSGAEVEGTARIVANYAVQHLQAAKLFRNQVVRLEAGHTADAAGDVFNEIRSYGGACLMSCAAGLEALINELFIAHYSPLREKLGDFERQFWGKSGIENQTFLKKYQTALRLLGAKTFDQQGRLYRDVWALHELRNALVHYKPTWDPEQHRATELQDELGGRFALSPFAAAGSSFVAMKCMSAGCARWAFQATLDFIAEFDSRTHIDDNKMVSVYRLRD